MTMKLGHTWPKYFIKAGGHVISLLAALSNVPQMHCDSFIYHLMLEYVNYWVVNARSSTMSPGDLGLWYLQT